MTTLRHSSLAPAAQAPPFDAEETAAFAVCRDVARRRARNFYYGLCLTPEPRRSAIYTIYAWMRAADDEADDAPSAEAARERLADRRATLASLVREESLPPARAHEPVWVALRAVLRAFPVNADDLFSMLDGLEEDAGHGGYATRADLRRYCFRVASTVGLVCGSIWGVRPEHEQECARVRTLAERRGIGFQLTNILRDFAQDFDIGRVYLPAEDFARAGLTPEDLRGWRAPEKCAALVADLAAWARGEYDASAPLDTMIDRACRPTLWAMTQIYSGLLEKIERAPERIVGTRRIRLQSAHKAGIAARAVWRSRRDAW